MEHSLWFLHKYIGEAAEKGHHLDHVLVPMLQHVRNFVHVLILCYLNQVECISIKACSFSSLVSKESFLLYKCEFNAIYDTS